MSQIHYVNNIEDATRGFDKLTKQYVSIEEQISSNFYICQPYDKNCYIICHRDNLTELHYM